MFSSKKSSKSSAILLSFPSKIISHHLCIIGFHSFSTFSSFFPSKIPQPPSAYRPPAGLRSILPPRALRSQPCAARRPVANPRPFWRASAGRALPSGLNKRQGMGIVNSRILKWRYCTIFLAIFCGDIPLHSPYIGLIYGRYLQFRFLKCHELFLENETYFSSVQLRV